MLPVHGPPRHDMMTLGTSNTIVWNASGVQIVVIEWEEGVTQGLKIRLQLDSLALCTMCIAAALVRYDFGQRVGQGGLDSLDVTGVGIVKLRFYEYCSSA